MPCALRPRTPVLTTLAYLAITIAFSIVISTVTSIFGITGAILGSETVGFFSVFISLILAIVMTLLAATIQFGYYVYCLKVFKHEETGVGELFGYFSLFLKVFGLSLWIALFVWLWSLLCFIPGIIAGLRYSQAFFILAENPEKGIRECVNESKQLMSGRAVGVLRAAALVHPLDASGRDHLRHRQPVCDALHDHHLCRLLSELKAARRPSERLQRL